VTDTDAVETHEYNGYNIKILFDIDPINPREEYDHLGTMLYVSRRYLLGDKCVSSEEIEETVERDDLYYISVYAHIHGGVLLSTHGFSDPWDSGQCGIIYVEKEKLAKEFPDLSGDDLDAKAEEILRSEVEEFSHYLSGEVYGFHVEKDDKHVDSCYGYYSVEDALEAAKERIQ
jgi:hypothetical protein